jgi:hypothetical protein
VRNVPTTRYDADGHDGWETFKAYVTVTVAAAETALSAAQEGGRGLAKRVFDAMTSGPPPQVGPAPEPRTCPAPGNQSGNNKQNNNSQSSNAQEQGRDAQGRFLPKKGGESAPGAAAEKEGLDSVGATKNTKPIPGSNRIPDGTIGDVEAGGQYVESKSGATITNTKQLRESGQAAMDVTGKPLKVVTTNPNAKVSGPAKNNPNLDIKPKE